MLVNIHGLWEICPISDAKKWKTELQPAAIWHSTKAGFCYYTKTLNFQVNQHIQQKSKDQSISSLLFVHPTNLFIIKNVHVVFSLMTFPKATWWSSSLGPPSCWCTAAWPPVLGGLRPATAESDGTWAVAANCLPKKVDNFGRWVENVSRCFKIGRFWKIDNLIIMLRIVCLNWTILKKTCLIDRKMEVTNINRPFPIDVTNLFSSIFFGLSLMFFWYTSVKKNMVMKCHEPFNMGKEQEENSWLTHFGSPLQAHGQWGQGNHGLNDQQGHRPSGPIRLLVVPAVLRQKRLQYLGWKHQRKGEFQTPSVLTSCVDTSSTSKWRRVVCSSKTNCFFELYI